MTLKQLEQGVVCRLFEPLLSLVKENCDANYSVEICVLNGAIC